MFYHGEKEDPELPSFSASGSGSGVQREDKMVEALVDLANEINFAHDDNNVDDIKPIDQEASTCDTMFV